MIYDWFKLINLDDFLALDLVSKELTLELEGLGEKEIMITKGNVVSVLYEGVYLPLEFNSQNPFEFDSHAVYLDANRDVWLGIATT